MALGIVGSSIGRRSLVLALAPQVRLVLGDRAATLMSIISPMIVPVIRRWRAVPIHLSSESVVL